MLILIYKKILHENANSKQKHDFCILQNNQERTDIYINKKYIPPKSLAINNILYSNLITIMNKCLFMRFFSEKYHYVQICIRKIIYLKYNANLFLESQYLLHIIPKTEIINCLNDIIIHLWQHAHNNKYSNLNYNS